MLAVICPNIQGVNVALDFLKENGMSLFGRIVVENKTSVDEEEEEEEVGPSTLSSVFVEVVLGYFESSGVEWSTVDDNCITKNLFRSARPKQHQVISFWKLANF